MKLTMELAIMKDGKPFKKFELKETKKAIKSEKTGKLSLAHFQPSPDNKVILPFSKLYLDTTNIKK